MKTILLFTWMAIFSSAGVFAQGGAGSSGGNGGGGEILFHAITVRLTHWLEEHLKDESLASQLHLKKGDISAQDLVKRYIAATQTAHIKFIPQKRLSVECSTKKDRIACLLKNSSRVCINSSQPVHVIECNEELFNVEKPDIQLAITFHEYLGLAQIEQNDSQDYSQYPISKYLLVLNEPPLDSHRPPLSEKKCLNEKIAILEEIFSQGQKDAESDALSLRCFEGRTNPDGGSFDIFSISDYLNRRTNLAVVLEKDELNQVCKHFGYRSGLIHDRPSAWITVDPKRFSSLKKSLKPGSTLWHHVDQSLHPIADLKCLR